MAKLSEIKLTAEQRKEAAALLDEMIEDGGDLEGYAHELIYLRHECKRYADREKFQKRVGEVDKQVKEAGGG